MEEKLDGANCGIRCEADERLRLQSRGHTLAGGPRERQFELLKSWAARHAAALHELLQTRYVLYGEWLYAKHTTFYTDLPHYLLEFDCYDRDADAFLSTARRRELLRSAPFVASVPVLHAGPLPSLAALTALVGPSRFIAADHASQLRAAAQAHALDPAPFARETDASGLMEGLYIKVEEGERVVARYKYVRPGFGQTVVDAGSHWTNRPLLPNTLRADVNLWSSSRGCEPWE